MRLPGLIACGLEIPADSSVGVFGIVRAASVVRLATWLRSGPTVPCADVPAIRWQLAHWALMNSRAPAPAWPTVGSRAGAVVLASHALNAAGVCANTSIAMF